MLLANGIDMFKKIVIFCILGLFFAIIFNNFSYALDLPRLSQSKIRLSIPAGQSQYGELTVNNPGTETMFLRFYLEDWRYTKGGDGSKEFVSAGTTSNSCASWINFSPSELTIPPLAQKKLNYTVKVPKDASGGHYAVLFAEVTSGSAKNEGVGVDLTFRIATLFYVEPKETIIRSAVLGDLNVKKVNASRIYAISANFKNTGNTDITASSTYHIMNNKGVVTARGAFNDVYTFSAESAKIDSTCKESLAQGAYDLVITMDLGKALKEANMGRGQIITKEADLVIGEDGEVLSVSKLR